MKSGNNIEQFSQRGFRAKQAGQYVGISQSMFWQLVKEGRIGRGRKIGNRCTVWLREQLDAFLESLPVANDVQ